ncbi:Nif11-like leader peptide family natural product precursor [Coleofasciculus sp. E1-EBD-02]|uniref:Nif11-like leader peptide family natural product precursor n=1 Tax=Coleofasciculus sp. E1-EBD-02 TaxID=3068481 RepID=UPI0032F3AE01
MVKITISDLRPEVLEFFKAVETDEALQEELKAADSPASVIKIAAENGYDFTELELQAAMKNHLVTPEALEDLPEEELLAVAGGCSYSVRCGHTCGHTAQAMMELL